MSRKDAGPIIYHPFGPLIRMRGAHTRWVCWYMRYMYMSCVCVYTCMCVYVYVCICAPISIAFMSVRGRVVVKVGSNIVVVSNTVCGPVSVYGMLIYVYV